MKPPSLPKDLSKISLTELLNAMRALEQRRLMREKKTIEGALAAKHEDDYEIRRPSAAKRKEWKSEEILSTLPTLWKEGPSSI